MRILIAEDEKTLNSLIKKVLVKEGYSVDCSFDGSEALDFLAVATYDACIFDIMMPRLDGITLVEKMRAQNNPTPVLFLTAKDSIMDRVKGLDSGADDYLIKPFDFDELLARLRAITRKYQNLKSSVLRIADLEIDVAKRSVKRGGSEISLSAKEFAILECLARNQGLVISREQIEESIYDFDYDGASNVVDVYISFLRKKIDSDYDHKLIQTVRGVGWSLKGE